MRLRKLDVSGFKSLVNFSIKFDDGLTLIVGENDSGKTSLIECLKVVTQGRQVRPDDLTYGQDQLIIAVEIDDFIFERKYKKEKDNVMEESFNAFPTNAFIEKTRSRLNSENFDTSVEDNQAYIKETARIFGLTVRSNSNIDNLRAGILEKLNNSQDKIIIENATFPRFNNIQLDGKQFENVPGFFKEVFLKEKQASIWQETISENTTIESFVRSHLEAYSNDMSKQIEEKGILSKLRIFLKDLTEIKVEPIFHARDLNVDAKVKFLENGNEINIDNKGDGTKRRITMALLEFKKEQTLIPNDSQTIYLLDEPDTHLHVKAQIELIETVKGFVSNGNQVILTTHSPFVLNAANPSQVRLLVKENNSTKIKFLKDDLASSAYVFRSLGIENTHIFFSRQLVIVEGETEEQFLHANYLARTQNTLSSGLIKIINVQGVQNIVGFSRGILEFHDPGKIFILCDNDISDDLAKLIAELGIPDEHKFFVGNREFEDAFSSEVLHRCWKTYHDECGRAVPDSWIPETIEQLRIKCSDGSQKFSKSLRELNQGGKAMTKPLLGKALGSYSNIDELPDPIHSLFSRLIN